ncbi:DUF6924 domain-containing protein [Streptomyces sp. CWNU-52B]|uniref:DUF6924 domain-containing protein n=1 Tax=unclassified Streptomyces TaxID=2593676 RepID=UPI0039BFC1C9
MRSPLPLPPDDDAARVPGMLLIRTGDGDGDGDGDEADVWNDVLSRMGELPGMRGPVHGPGADTETSLPRRLIVAHDPAWRGATVEEVAEALEQPGIWIPDLVVLTDDRTARNQRTRPLLAFGGSDGDISSFWITPRQAAMTYLVLNRPYTSSAIDDFAERAPTDPEWEVAEDEELGEDHFYEPVGVALETLSTPPRYTRPARELPLLSHETDLLVRTDFSDDAAWASLVERVSQPPYDTSVDDDDDDAEDDGDDEVEGIRFVDDPAFAGATPEQLMAQVRPSEDVEEMVADVILIADTTTLHEPEHRVLVIPLTDDIGLTFRVDPDQVGVMLPNLALGNQDIEDWRKDEG